MFIDLTEWWGKTCVKTKSSERLSHDVILAHKLILHPDLWVWKAVSIGFCPTPRDVPWSTSLVIALTLPSLLLFPIADQVYGDQDMHEVVRKHCMDYLVRSFRGFGVGSRVGDFSLHTGFYLHLFCRWRMLTTSLTTSQRTSLPTSTGSGKTTAMATTLRCKPWQRCTTGLWRFTSTVQVLLWFVMCWSCRMLRLPYLTYFECSLSLHRTHQHIPWDPSKWGWAHSG